MTETLQKLKGEVDVILETLSAPEVKGDAINWGDLRCVEALHCENDAGNKYFMVLIEEADPGATKLQIVVAKKLADSGWGCIEVKTEW